MKYIIENTDELKGFTFHSSITINIGDTINIPNCKPIKVLTRTFWIGTDPTCYANYGVEMGLDHIKLGII